MWSVLYAAGHYHVQELHSTAAEQQQGRQVSHAMLVNFNIGHCSSPLQWCLPCLCFLNEPLYNMDLQNNAMQPVLLLHRVLLAGQ